jgi:hypothetical protein
LVEGFVSPSGIDFTTRIAVLGLSLTLWAVYFFAAGLESSSQAGGVATNEKLVTTR